MDDERCVAPADRTAFALGQLECDVDGARREAIARHLLRCAPCRAEVDAVSALGARLRGFASGGDWETDVGAALAAERGRARIGRRAAFAGFAAAAAVVAALGAALALGAGERSSPASAAGPAARSTAAARVAPVAPSASVATPPREAPVAAERARLLAAQSADGRFSASASVGGSRRDEATTGLAVLALVGEAGGLPQDPAAARAVADAVRWLRTRQTASGRFGAEASGTARDQAIPTAALLEVSAATHDPGLRALADRGVRALARDVDDAATLPDEEGGRWVRCVLARAHALSNAPTADVAPRACDTLVAERWPSGLSADDSPYGRALAVVARSRRE